MAVRDTDALTGASLLVQGLAARGLRTALSLAFALTAILRAAVGMPPALEVVLSVGYLALLASAIRRRHRRRAREATPSRLQLDVELCTACAVVPLLLATERSLPFDVPIDGLSMLGMAASVALCSPRVGAACWLLCAAFFSVLHLCLPTRAVLPSVWTLVLLAVAGGGTALVLRRLATRVETRAQRRLQRELESVRDVARAYRLTSTRHLADAAEAEGGLDERLLRSSVEEIQASLRSSLSLCRVALDATSVVLLLLDESGSTLHVRGYSSQVDDLRPGPFSAGEGVFGAVLGGTSPLELLGSRSIRHLPYYGSSREIGHVVLLPIFDDHERVGLLAIDRQASTALLPHELEVLGETARLAKRTVDNERAFLELDRAKVEQSKLYRAVERLNEASTEVAVIQAGVGSAREFAAFHFAAVTLLRDGGTHEICAVSGEGAGDLVGKTFRDSRGLVGMVTENRHPLPYRGQCESGVQVVFSRGLRTPKLSSLLVLPLLVHREVLGTLVLGSLEPGAFGNAERMTLQVLARHVAVSLANARMVQRLEELATTDGLTGLLNKRALTEVGRQKLLSAQRFHKSLSVLICDLDHFKAVNDTHGHDVGDRVIAGFSGVLSRTKRETDAVGRFGGEEFVLVCEQTDVEGALLLAERVRSELAATTFVTPTGSLKVTASVGVATFPVATGSWDELFKAADEALYAAKRAGRDRAVVWSPTLGSRAAS